MNKWLSVLSTIGFGVWLTTEAEKINWWLGIIIALMTVILAVSILLYRWIKDEEKYSSQERNRKIRESNRNITW